MISFDQLAGRVFGRLTVTEKSEKRGRNRRYWLCVCECGNSKFVIVDSLKSGHTQSCGCLSYETRRTVRKPGAMKDGQHSPEYTVWHSMKQRCTNQNKKNFWRYGGRGITVCQQWLDNFSQFLADMGPRPSPAHTIERKDNDAGYSPENCKWATRAEQNRNHSRNRFLTFNGETLCLEDWGRRTGIPHATLSWRLRHWTLERALTDRSC